jgi:hypothetical protein
VADVLQNLAWLYYYEISLGSKKSPTDLQFLEDMDKCFNEALTIREELLRDAPPGRKKPFLRDVVFTKLGIAAAYLGQKSILDAKRIVNEPVLRREIIELQGNEKQADALRHFIKAGDAIGFGQPAEAIDELNQGLKLIEGAGIAESILAGRLNFELAHLLVRVNRLAEAEKKYRDAFEIARRERMFQMPQQSDKVNAFGELLRKSGKHKEAEELRKEYLAGLKFRFGDQHKFYKEAASDFKEFLPTANAAR